MSGTLPGSEVGPLSREDSAIQVLEERKVRDGE